MTTAPEPAEIRLLPDELRVQFAKVEAHAPTDGMAGGARAMVLMFLALAHGWAEVLATFVPLAVEGRGPQQLHAPLSERPRVPRVVEEAAVGADPRLPPGRPHP